MAYERLNLKNGQTLDAKHIKHMEDGISSPSWNDLTDRPFYEKNRMVKELWETFSIYSSTLDELPAPGQSYVIEFEGKSYKTTTYDTSANGRASMGVGNPTIFDKYAQLGADDADNSKAPEDAYDLPFYGVFEEKFNSSGIYYQFILFTHEGRGFPDEETKITFYQEVEVETIEPIDYKFMPEGYPKVETETVEVVPEQSVTKQTEQDGVYVGELDFSYNEGENYKVKINGKEHRVTVKKENDSLYYLGNANLFRAEDGEPFLISKFLDADCIMWRGSLGETITLAIYEEKEVVEKLDPKFVDCGKNIYYADDNRNMYKDEERTVGVTINDLMNVLNGCVVSANGSYENVCCVNASDYLNGFQVVTVNSIGSQSYYTSTDIEYGEEG